MSTHIDSFKLMRSALQPNMGYTVQFLARGEKVSSIKSDEELLQKCVILFHGYEKKSVMGQ